MLFSYLLMPLNQERLLSGSPAPFVQVLCPVERNKQESPEYEKNSIRVINVHITHF